MQISEQTAAQSSPENVPLETALRQISVFADLRDDQLQWFAANAEDVRLAPGEIHIREGDPADSLFVVLEGELRARRESGGPDSPVFIARAGQVSGFLPYSRLTHYQLVSRAVVPTRLARLHKDRFPEMLERIPELNPRLVAVLADRIRESTRADQQRDKLSALGKLSAGLAHELNNPASAASRSAESLRECQRELRRISKMLDASALSCQQRSLLTAFEDQVLEGLASLPAMDALEQSDREEDTSAWLKRHGISSTSRLVSGLVEAGIDEAALESLRAKLPGEALPQVLERVVATACAERLVREIETSTGRISELVRAIKEYTYMDQAPEQEVDLHQGIDNTLTMLKFRLKKGIQVKREYDRTLPRLCAHGSELNQVWTNLIDNAIDAMGGKGELTIRTSAELDCALIEVIDNGPGVPEDLKSHLFEPFFTTKGVGAGTGLGLDTVYRIVRTHRGEVSFDSKPGHTVFRVRLPLRGKTKR